VKKLTLFLSAMLVMMFAPALSKAQAASPIPATAVNDILQKLTEKYGDSTAERMERGIKHAASLWRKDDGPAKEFTSFCLDNYINDAAQREAFFKKVSQYLEAMYGHFDEITLALQKNVQLATGPMLPIDKMFAGYSVGSHMLSDLYRNKIAFAIALNFPYYPLADKEKFASIWSREEWANARLGDIFSARVPAKLEQAYAEANTKADLYISEYNIEMGHLRTNDDKQLFPDDMVLLSHWNLRDEIKADYADNAKGPQKQEMIYEVMKRIIDQDIPEKVINNPAYEWQPFANKLYNNGKEVVFKPGPNTRYQQILNNFHALKAIDAYYPVLDTYIKRKFSGEMEIPQPKVEALFDTYLRSPELKQIGALIAERLGRPLRPYDIWYDGFKARSSIPEQTLNEKAEAYYPDPKAFKEDMPNLLKQLGWSDERANFIASKIAVDPARGSGHAWGAQMIGEKSHLRTRIPSTGMNYKGYNIAVHEFGHNVEQTISLYNIDYYMLHGVPSTAFTEALAFIFQSRDLKLLGITDENPHTKYLNALDNGWSLMEIMGVGMVDMKVWKWLYAHPDADSAELKTAVINISKDVWNTYFSPIFGTQDEPILAIYSHMISYPLYLPAYSYGQLIEFQLEEYLKGKNFSDEVDRIYEQGRLTPQQWMEEAVGQKISAQPVLNAVDEALKAFK
jgi:hypothetical protein